MIDSRPVNRYRLRLEYDGTRYSGWQKQTDARTIQGTLLEAGAVIFGEPVDIQGNGRTDAGVHALDYTAHLETHTVLPAADIAARFNELLPTDIVVLAVESCSPRFHARHNCIGRSYLYRFSLRKSAFAKRHVWWIKGPLDVAAMAAAGDVFVGMHDFVAFAEKQELKKSTQVLINAVQVFGDEEMIRLRIVGSHFLWKMVRRMAAVLVEVGRHEWDPHDMAALLRSGTEAPALPMAPPRGLFFERAFYDEGALAAFLAETSGRP
jgi:tRNA pseudouridine38-40 synthase